MADSMTGRFIGRGLVVAILLVTLTTSLVVTAPLVHATAASPMESPIPAFDRPNQLEPNDEFENATNITLPYERQDLDASFDDTDIYAVSLQPGDRVTTELTFTHADGDIDLFVLDPNKDLIRQSTSITDDETTSFQAGISGTYYIVVEGWAEATTTYSMTVTGTADELPINDEFEYNDGFSTATEISPSFDRAELRLAGGEYDYYAVTLPQNTQLNVTARHNASIADIELRIYNETETLLGIGFSAFDNETASVQAESGGTYYIEVFTRNDGSAWYHLNLTTEPISPTDPTTTSTQTSTTSEATPTQTTTSLSESTTTSGTDGPGFTILLALTAISIATIGWLRRD